MKVLVTGGAGFIGRTLVKTLLERGWEVRNLDLLTYAAVRVLEWEKLRNYQFIEGDVRDPILVAEALRGVEAVLHLAAESHVDRSIRTPNRFLETNIIGTSVLLEAARQASLPHFVYVSTDEVYGDIGEGPPSVETDPVRPSSPYAVSKTSADLLVQAYVRSHGLPAVITRGSNTYGPGQHPEKFLPRMIGCALAGRSLPIYGDGLQRRDWLHVDDHVAGILAALERGTPGGIYNLAGGNSRNNLEMVQLLLKAGGLSARVEPVADRPGHDRRYALNADLAERMLGWKPEKNLERGIGETIAWYRANPAFWEARLPAGGGRSDGSF